VLKEPWFGLVNSPFLYTRLTIRVALLLFILTRLHSCPLLPLLLLSLILAYFSSFAVPLLRVLEVFEPPLPLIILRI
jgi:hypothetical protein